MQKITDNIYVLVILGMAGSFLLVASFIIIFIRNQNRLLRQRQQLQEARLQHQAELMRAVIESQEAERRRIGQDLHDSVGTALSNLRIAVDMYDGAAAAAHDTGGRCKTLIDRIILDVRGIAHNLSPPGLVLYGLKGALEDLCENMVRAGSLQVSLSNNAGSLPDELPQSKAILLYRVMEELLNNTMKHARATTAHIGMTSEEGVLLVQYRDDGTGMPTGAARKKGMGLQNIESRLGLLNAIYTFPVPTHPGFAMHIKIKHPDTA